VRVAQRIMANSAQVFLAADHTKFGRNAMCRSAQVDQLDALFTDRPPTPAYREVLEAAGVVLHVTPAWKS